MKAGFIQTNPEFGRIERNVGNAVREIGSLEADLVVLPELFSTGYQFRSAREALDLSEEIPGGATTEKLLSAAASLDLIIVAGIAERHEGKVYNSSVLISPGGLTAVYRKAHLFWNEKRFFTPGATPFEIYEVMGVKIGMMICFDWLFPEAARTLSLKGADIICHPSNLVLPYCPDAMITRSLENRVFSITANRVGVEERIEGEPLRFIGSSQIVSPVGEVLVRAGGERAETGVVEIDPGLARDKKVTPTNDIFEDRRTGLFSL